jgi:hypothetical protein
VDQTKLWIVLSRYNLSVNLLNSIDNISITIKMENKAHVWHPFIVHKSSVKRMENAENKKNIRGKQKVDNSNFFADRNIVEKEDLLSLSGMQHKNM